MGVPETATVTQPLPSLPLPLGPDLCLAKGRGVPLGLPQDQPAHPPTHPDPPLPPPPPVGGVCAVKIRW